jgi:hypothetical protein
VAERYGVGEDELGHLRGLEQVVGERVAGRGRLARQLRDDVARDLLDVVEGVGPALEARPDETPREVGPLADHAGVGEEAVAVEVDAEGFRPQLAQAHAGLPCAERHGEAHAGQDVGLAGQLAGQELAHAVAGEVVAGEASRVQALGAEQGREGGLGEAVPRAAPDPEPQEIRRRLERRVGPGVEGDLALLEDRGEDGERQPAVSYPVRMSAAPTPNCARPAPTSSTAETTAQPGRTPGRSSTSSPAAA